MEEDGAPANASAQYAEAFAEDARPWQREVAARRLARQLVAERSDELRERLQAAWAELPDAMRTHSLYSVWSGYGPGVKRRLHIWPEGDEYGRQAGGRLRQTFTACGAAVHTTRSSRRDWEHAALGERSDQVELRDAERAAVTDEQRRAVQHERAMRHYHGQLVDEDRLCERCREVAGEYEPLLRAEAAWAAESFYERPLLPGTVAIAAFDATRVLADELSHELVPAERHAEAAARALRMGVALTIADELRRPAALRSLFEDCGARWLDELLETDPVRVAGAATREQWARAIFDIDAATDGEEPWQRRQARDERLLELLRDALVGLRTSRRARRR